MQAEYRLCPGREFADATVFLAMAGMIAALDIGKARDAEGNYITPKASFASTSIVRSVKAWHKYCQTTYDRVCYTVIPRNFPVAYGQDLRRLRPRL